MIIDIYTTVTSGVIFFFYLCFYFEIVRKSYSLD